ncbi:MAG: SanA/YdcF family protein [Methylomicrobium sp.]
MNWHIASGCLLGTSIAVVLAIAAVILIDGFTDDLDKADTAVVLGNTVYPDGTPSPRLKARLDKAVELYRQGYFRRIIVSGAHGVEGYDEARVMKDYLISHGVEAKAILPDPNGFNTFETARNTAALLRRAEDKSVMVITQYFHITRSRLALNKFGITEVRSAHANYFGLRDIYSLLREVVAIPVYLLKKGPDAKL